MDCQHARELLDASRPGRADWNEVELQAAAGHVEHCRDCADVVAARDRFDARLRSAMQSVEVPAGFKPRLLDVLAQVRPAVAAATAEPRRIHRRWLAAAVLSLLAVAAMWTFLGRPPESVALHRVYESLDTWIPLAIADSGATREFDGGFNADVGDAAWQVVLKGPPRGIDVDDVPGHDAAAYPFDAGRGLTGWLVVLPRERVSDPPAGSVPNRSAARFAPRPQVAWTADDQVYVCVLTHGSLDGLLREMYGSAA
jgi:hypothetical protein